MAKKANKVVLKTPKTQDANRNIRKHAQLLFAINVIFEAAAAGLCFFCVFFACNLDDLSEKCAFVFLHLILAAFIPDIAYVFMMFKLTALGIDPLGVCFNFVLGGLCIGIGLALLTVFLFDSEDMGIYLQGSAGVLTFLSGFVHITNGFECNKHIPLSEKYYRPRDPMRRQLRKERKRLKREEKKNRKAAAKGTSPSASKKVDKKPAKSKGTGKVQPV